jgi:hypothetical protein
MGNKSRQAPDERRSPKNATKEARSCLGYYTFIPISDRNQPTDGFGGSGECHFFDGGDGQNYLTEVSETAIIAERVFGLLSMVQAHKQITANQRKNK